MMAREFEAHYRRVYPRTLAYARRRAHGDHQLAEDLVQIAATNLWQVIERGKITIESEGHFAALMHQRVGWGVAAHYSKFSNTRELLSLSDDQIQGLDGGFGGIAALTDRDPRTWSASAEETVLARDIPAEVVQAVRALPQRSRQMLWERHVEGQSAREMAEHRGVVPGHVENLLYDARKAVNHLISHPDDPISGLRFRKALSRTKPVRRRTRPRPVKKPTKVEPKPARKVATEEACANGHPWTEANAYADPRSGQFKCRKCRAESNLENYYLAKYGKTRAEVKMTKLADAIRACARVSA